MLNKKQLVDRDKSPSEISHQFLATKLLVSLDKTFLFQAYHNKTFTDNDMEHMLIYGFWRKAEHW